MATLSRNLETFQKIRELALAKDPDVIMILSGSTSLALQGVDIKVHDIDIDTDEKGAKLLDAILGEHQATRIEYYGTDKYCSWHGRYAYNGCDIDVMGEFRYKLENGEWSTPEHKHLIHFVDYRGSKIPVLSLEQELKEYENTNRVIKIAKIKAALQQQHQSRVRRS